MILLFVLVTKLWRQSFSSDPLHSRSLSLSLYRKYTSICSHNQRQSYKQDFNKEYSEYRDLHARIDSVTQQFMDLETQLKQLHRESHKYKVRHEEVNERFYTLRSAWIRVACART